MRQVLVLVVAALALAGGARRVAAQAEPTGPHPRIVLDDGLRATWKRQAKDKGSGVAAAIRACGDYRARPKEFARDLYMGLDWASRLQACLVAWAATADDAHAKTAVTFVKALLDDVETIGDGKGGDTFAARNSGYAIRSTPYVAIAYDWLHDHAAMTAALKEKARARFAAWTDWYVKNGYRARSPGTNYQAGYLLAATLIAVAQGGEAGPAGTRLWNHVAKELWQMDMKKALAPGGVLDGGDWGEGWQYGAWSVAEYALGARVMRAHGVEVPGVDRWLDGLLRRAVHGSTPRGQWFVGGDTQELNPYLPANYLVFAAVLIGDAAPEAWARSRAELAERGLTEDVHLLYRALAEAREVTAKAAARDTWPTSYLAPGTSTFYARTHWGGSAVWMAAQCSKTIEVDHMHPNAGNVVLSRGTDDVIVDPTPYGALSTLPGNAPTVESAHLPDDYKPSQAYWSEQTRFVWARQTASGIVAARCDYADQYKFQHRPSDVPEAVRDVVLVPYAKGDAAAMVVIDRARSGDKARALHLRFRTLADLALAGEVATGSVGATQLAIRRVASSSGKPAVRDVKGNRKGCFIDGVTRGGCDVPRFDVDEYKLVVDGPAMSAIHVLDVAGPQKAAPAVGAVKGADGVVLARDGRHAVVVDAGGKDVTYTAPKAAQGGTAHHVIVGASSKGGQATVSAKPDGDGCAVTVRAGGAGTAVDAAPVVVVLDDACAVTEEASLVNPLAATGGTTGGGIASAGGDGGGGGTGGGGGGDDTGAGGGDGAAGGGSPGGDVRSPRTGCCGAQATPGSPIAMTVIVAIGLAFVLGRRRR